MTNFLFPGAGIFLRSNIINMTDTPTAIFGIAYIINIYVDPSYIVHSTYIFIVSYYVSIIGVVFATGTCTAHSCDIDQLSKSTTVWRSTLAYRDHPITQNLPSLSWKVTRPNASADSERTEKSSTCLESTQPASGVDKNDGQWEEGEQIVDRDAIPLRVLVEKSLGHEVQEMC